jgi:hypothetical protein
MHKESFIFEWRVIDFIYKNLVSSKYLDLEWLNILIPHFAWMQRSFHLSIEIFGGLARNNAHFNPRICIGIPSILTHRQGP